MSLSLIGKIPASFIYGIGVWVRNFLYDTHILRSYKTSIPTICVGNLAVGGTGKTPHVEWLIRFLTPSYRVAVLSRGYKRQTEGFVLADENSTVLDIGDECMQLHRKFPTLPIAVCKDRVKGIEMLQKHITDLQVVLLDDAFQYRRLECGCNIVLTTADNLFATDHLLPWGSLRDLRSQIQRAHAVIVTKCPDNFSALDRRCVLRTLHLPDYQQAFFSRMKYAPLPSDVENMPDDAYVLLLTGIAKPEYLRVYLKQRFVNLHHIAFADHHNFSKTDLLRIEKEAQLADVVLTTEKDIVRLETLPLSDSLQEKLHAVSIEANVMEEKELQQFIERYIKSCIY